MNKKRSFWALIAILAISLLVWGLKTNGKNAPTKTISVGFKEVEKSPESQTIKVSGFVRGENRAEISPASAGRIIKIFKHEGDSVRKGEVLATIDANVSQAQVNAASASVNALEKTLNDSKDYYDQTVDQTKESGADHESVQTAKRARDLQIQATKDQLLAAQGALQIAKAGQGNFTLTAPFSGTISSIYGREGGFANFSMPLFSLSTQKGLEIETYISASDARLVTLGLIANFKAADGQTINATVTNVAPGSDSSNFKTLIRLHLNDETNLVRLGDFLEGQLLIPTGQDAIYVPKKAVVNRGGALLVFTLDENDTVHENLIVAENENEENVKITKGVAADQKIIVEGQQYLAEGLNVKPYESR